MKSMIHRRRLLENMVAGAGGLLFGSGIVMDPIQLLSAARRSAAPHPRKESVFIHPQAKALEVDPLTSSVLVASMGYAATVCIDEKHGVVRKSFLVNGTCVGGAKPLAQFNTIAEMKRLYDHEKEALTRLIGIKSRFIHPEIRFDDSQLEIVTPFLGYDLLASTGAASDGFRLSPEHAEQIIEMNHEYRQVGLFKQNVTLSHLVKSLDSGKLLAIDFKWWAPRTKDAARFEMKQNIRWLSTFNPELPQKLLATMTPDFGSFFIADEFQHWVRRFREDAAVWVNREERIVKAVLPPEEADRLIKIAKKSFFKTRVV